MISLSLSKCGCLFKSLNLRSKAAKNGPDIRAVFLYIFYMEINSTARPLACNSYCGIFFAILILRFVCFFSIIS